MGGLRRLLEKNTTLQTLDLGDNSVERVVHASALKKNTTKTLDLYDNSVGDAGASSLASALEKNTTLQTLSLGRNSVDDAGASSLASALEKNTTLQTLDPAAARWAMRARRPRVAREEYDAADAQPWPQLGGRCGRVVPRVGAREEYDAADANLYDNSVGAAGVMDFEADALAMASCGVSEIADTESPVLAHPLATVEVRS